jgi:hypothetical protein
MIRRPLLSRAIDFAVLKPSLFFKFMDKIFVKCELEFGRQLDFAGSIIST